MKNDQLMNELLYGHDRTEGIVSIEVDGSVVHEFIQTYSGEVVENQYHNYKPWVYRHTNNGNTDDQNYYNTIDRLNNFKDYYWEKIHRSKGIKLGAGFRNGAVNTELPSVYMIDTGKTLFKGLNFDDVHQMGFDIETTGLYSDKSVVKMISLADNRGYKKVLFNNDEKQLILDFIDEIRIKDPSILLTYNGSSFDIPFLLNRCEVLKIHLTLGRDESVPTYYDVPLRLGVGDKDKKKPGYRIFGRQHVDLYYSVKKFDSTNRKLENYKLKYVISKYGLEKEGRIHLSADEIFEGLSSPKDSQKYKDVYEYCLDDSVDLINLHPYVNQAEFYLSQIIPMNYDILTTKGNVGRSNYMMLRGYLKNYASVPMWSEHIKKEELYVGLEIKPFNDTPNLSKESVYTIESYSDSDFTIRLDDKTWNYSIKYLELFKVFIRGAVVETDETGIFEHVGDSDITSMYPNMMIQNDIFPENDTMGLMKKMLVSLTHLRIEAKTQMKKETNPIIKAQKQGQQLAYKVLINAQFGILSTNGFFWKDPLKCMSVTAHGRDLIVKIRDHIISKGFKITALDTDGVAYTNGEAFDINEMNKSIQDMLPTGIDIESQMYKGMIVFKRKTYVVRDENNELTFKGAAMTAISTSPVIRNFLKKICMLLFDKKYDDVKIAYSKLIDDIKSTNYPIEMFSSIKQVNNTIEEYIAQKTLWNKDKDEFRLKYNKKQFAQQQIYELAIKTKRELEVGDKVSFYHSTEMQPKPYTPSQIKKQEERDMTISMFEVDIIRKMHKVQIIKWTDDFNNDLDPDYYINQVNDKIESLFLKKKVEKLGKKWNEGVLNESLYGYIFAELEHKTTEFIYKDFSTVIDGYFQPWQRIPVKTVWNYMAQGMTDAFVSVQLFGSDTKKDYEFAYHQLYFDIDNPDLNVSFDDAQLIYIFFKNVLLVDPKYITVWYSGSKGFHIEVNQKLFGITPRQNSQLINKEIALYLIDKYDIKSLDIGSIYSKNRLWRLPFSVHSKTGIRKTRVPDIDTFDDVFDVQDYVDHHQDVKKELTAYKTSLHEMSDAKTNSVLRDWFEDFIKIYEKKQAHVINQNTDLMFKSLDGKLPKCVEFLIRNSISKNGDRNKATMILSAFFKEFGKTQDECIDIITDWTLNIPDGLTSTTSHGDIVNNIKTVVSTIYNKDSYNFQCYFIKPLISKRGFSCAINCKLAD